MRISRRRPSLAAVHEREYVRSLDAGERGKAIGAGNRERGPGGIGAAAGGRRCDPSRVLLCPCTTPCPCRSGRRPTHPACEAATFVHVVRGHYGALILDGLKFVDVADMQRGAWIVVYGESATPDDVEEAMLRVAENMLMPRTFFAPLLSKLLGPR